MKILLTISSHLDPNSGAAGTTLRLGREYEKLGHEVQFYSFDNLPKRLPAAIRMVTFPEVAASHVFNLVRQQAIDVVDAPTGDGWLWAKWLKQSNKQLPLIVTRSHGLENTLHLDYLKEATKGNLKLNWKYFLYRGSWRLWEETTALKNADLVFLLNREDANFAVKQLQVNRDRIHVVANGIPDSFIGLPFEPLPAASNAPLHIAQIGTYVERKGIRYTVPALNSILQRYSHVHISFLGTGCPETQVYEDFAPELRDRITVIPRYSLEELPTLLKDHQIKLFAPLSEAFGKVLVEAMSCGLAPVTSAAAGPLEVVRDGHDALVVPIGNAIAIEAALEQLIRDQTYLETIRRNAYATAQDYSWSNVANQRLCLYQAALTELHSQNIPETSKKSHSHKVSDH